MRSELLIPKTCGERIAAKVRFMELDDEKRRLQTQETLIEDPNQSASFAGEATSTDHRGQDQSEGKPPLNQADIFKALEVVERDSVAIAESFTSLFSSLRLALSEVTHCSTDHMQCFNDAAGHLQESVLDAATKGNRYINSCLRLNEELKGIDTLATQLKILRRNVDALDSAVNKLVRLP